MNKSILPSLMKKPITLFCILAAGMLFFFSCKKDKSSDDSGTGSTSINPTAETILGTWKDKGSGSPFELTFKDTGYLIEASGLAFEWGQYSFSGSNIAMDPRSSSICNSYNGTYTCTIAGDSLKFTKIGDTCNYRAGILAITYTKQ
jgi:hypothetical protein